jgi:uncharacterized OB-fold protein
MENKELLPPELRTDVWAPVSRAAESAEFILQQCSACESIQYPPREICHVCLEDALEWRQISNKGKLISHTNLHASTNAFFRENAPSQIALVKLGAGPIIFAHIATENAQTGDRVYLLNRLDISDESVFVAISEDADEKIQLNQLDLLLKK